MQLGLHSFRSRVEEWACRPVGDCQSLLHPWRMPCAIPPNPVAGNRSWSNAAMDMANSRYSAALLRNRCRSRRTRYCMRIAMRAGTARSSVSRLNASSILTSGSRAASESAVCRRPPPYGVLSQHQRHIQRSSPRQAVWSSPKSRTRYSAQTQHSGMVFELACEALRTCRQCRTRQSIDTALQTGNRWQTSPRAVLAGMSGCRGSGASETVRWTARS